MHVFVFDGYAQKHTLRVREKTGCHKVQCEQHLRGTKPYQVSNYRNLVPDKGWAGEAQIATLKPSKKRNDSV